MLEIDSNLKSYLKKLYNKVLSLNGEELQNLKNMLLQRETFK